jgi:hypothetical protein
LIRINVPEQRQKWTRPLQVTGIKNFDLVGLGITVSLLHEGHKEWGRNSQRTVPRMVLTRSCQSLMTFKYVIELDDLVNISLSRVVPGARVRVSKRLIEPLREPVYTRLWLPSYAYFYPQDIWTHLLLMECENITVGSPERRTSLKLSKSCMSKARCRTPGISREI